MNINTNVATNSGTMSATLPMTINSVGQHAYTTAIPGGGSYVISPQNVTPSTIISLDNNSKSLSVKGDAVFEGKIEFDGLDLGARLEKIEQRLAIVHTNNDLELRWDDLRALGEQYRALERELLERERLVDILAQ